MRLTFVSAANPQRIDADTIDLDVVFDELGAIRFSATRNDCMPYGRELFARAEAGEFGPVPDPVQGDPAP